MATSRPPHMLTILLLLNSTHSTPMRCIASAHPSLATHTNLPTSLRLSGQALLHRFWRLRKASPSSRQSLRTYVCASCGCFYPVLLPHLKHYSLVKCTLAHGVGCPI